MDTPTPPPSEQYAALDAAVWRLHNTADAARIRALATALEPDAADDERVGIETMLAAWLILARTYGLAVDVRGALLWLEVRLGGDEGFALTLATLGRDFGAFSLTDPPGAAAPVVRLDCPSSDFLALLHPDA